MLMCLRWELLISISVLPCLIGLAWIAISLSFAGFYSIKMCTTDKLSPSILHTSCREVIKLVLKLQLLLCVARSLYECQYHGFSPHLKLVLEWKQPIVAK